MLEVGRIGRPHGIRGDVAVHLSTTERSRVAPGSILFAGDRALEVVSARPHQQHWIVSFAGVASREDADALKGRLLLAEPLDRSTDDDAALWVHELIGARVMGRDDEVLGVVEAVQENPASDLLVLDTGPLVPLTFVVGWVERGELLRVDLPEGLLDL